MPLKVKQILEVLENIAPKETAEEWDNVGLLAGSADFEVSRILLALDFTMGVLDEAEEMGAELIITHHPILFNARKNLTEDDPEGKLLARLIRLRIALIAVHTNFDFAQNGVNDALAQRFGLNDVQALESGMRIGYMPPVTLAELSEMAQFRLGGAVRSYGNKQKTLSRIAVMGGAGGSYWNTACDAGADAYITGEISYHYALDALASGMCVLEAGHAETERPSVMLLKSGLQNALFELQYSVELKESAALPY